MNFYLELAGYVIITIAIFITAILIVVWIILPFMAWLVQKFLGE